MDGRRPVAQRSAVVPLGAWAFRTEPRSDMLFSIAIIATLVVVTIVLLVVVLVDALA